MSWVCERCTYINDANKKRCSICLKAAPKGNKALPSPPKRPSPPKKSTQTVERPSEWLPPLYKLMEPILHPTTPFVRSGLVVKQTKLRKAGKRLPFNGLFTTVDLPAYAFLGYYAGTFYEEYWDGEALEDVTPPPVSHYAVNLSGFTIVPPGHNGPSPEKYPLAMMNEPPRNMEANAGVIEWLYARDAVPGLKPSEKVLVAAIHVCRAVAANEEIYFYYGDLYDRRHYGRKPYNVGFGCKTINRAHVSPAETPRNYLESRGILSVPEGEVYISI